VCFFRLHVVIGLQAIGREQKTQSPDLEEEACSGRRLIGLSKSTFAMPLERGKSVTLLVRALFVVDRENMLTLNL
jgi:hypothetical protein